MRKRKWHVDGRLKLEVGDRVKISKAGRIGIKKNTGIELKPSDLAKVTKIEYDLSEGRFFAVVRARGTDFWMPISDLTFYSK